MAKKKITEEFEGGISSLMSLVSSVDDQAEIIADSAFSNIQDWIGSGNYVLNACMSGDLYKAIPTGRIITFCGPSGTGKSYLATSCAREAQKKGYIPIILDSEGAYTSDFVKRLGVDPTRVIIKQVNTILESSQFIANLLEKLQEQHDKYGDHDKVILILDSLGNLTTEKEKDDTLKGDNKVDFNKAKDTKALFRVNATPLAKMQVPFIVCNHTYQSISFIPQNIQSSGSGIVYNASVTIELSAAKLEDKENDNAAKTKQGAESVTKTGILVTAKPVKQRFARPIKTKFQIPFFKKPNPYIGLEQFMNWENSGCCRGNMLTQKEYDKLSDSEKAKIHVFEFNGETMYCQEKDTARGIVCKHLGRQVSFIEFWSDTVFTPEFLDEINKNVIHPIFQLPDQSAQDDIADIENALEIGTDVKETNDPIAEVSI